MNDEHDDAGPRGRVDFRPVSETACVKKALQPVSLNCFRSIKTSDEFVSCLNFGSFGNAKSRRGCLPVPGLLTVVFRDTVSDALPSSGLLPPFGLIFCLLRAIEQPVFVLQPVVHKISVCLPFKTVFRRIRRSGTG
ncbi:hypothetical protein BaRGS_00002115 [Batillaria attramentaria]|uniref:Uncharacterized protein n=1 Tax=Batillaria attramentaria TaxID=370345 RepID=A0ABD0M557_9CAEN